MNLIFFFATALSLAGWHLPLVSGMEFLAMCGMDYNMSMLGPEDSYYFASHETYPEGVYGPFIDCARNFKVIKVHVIANGALKFF